MKVTKFELAVPAGKSSKSGSAKPSPKTATAEGKSVTKPAEKKPITTKKKVTGSNSTAKATKPKADAKTKASTGSTKGATKPPTTNKSSATKAKASKEQNGKASKGSKSVAEKHVAKASDPGLVSKELAQEMMHELCKLYPDADCELTHKNDFELLTSVILSAQTTDVQVNKVTPNLFKKFPTAKALAEGNLDDIKELIKATGYYNNKAKAIQACAAAIMSQFNGKVPDNLEDLTKLPGVGRKTANVVLGVVHKIPGWTVDTHVQRLSQRLGFTKNTDPYKIELDLQELFPKQDWTKYSITIIWHGRRLCYARKPDCIHCPLNRTCPSSEAPLGK